MARKPKTPRNPATPEAALRDLIRTGRGRRKRKLSSEDWDALVQMLAFKLSLPSIDVDKLAPAGSFLARMTRHFRATDIAYALPLMQTIMIAASKLTQDGAVVTVEGVGEIMPTLWTIGLAESGDAKTLSCDEVLRILSADGEPAVAVLPTGSTDAQWIIDLSENNGSYGIKTRSASSSRAFSPNRTTRGSSRGCWTPTRTSRSATV